MGLCANTSALHHDNGRFHQGNIYQVETEYFCLGSGSAVMICTLRLQ
jgi:hypothetical protein